jgi:hypothetical protein
MFEHQKLVESGTVHMGNIFDTAQIISRDHPLSRDHAIFFDSGPERSCEFAIREEFLENLKPDQRLATATSNSSEESC